jgi:hypothetical protein
MALLNQTQQQYYQGNDFGNYQFISLAEVINQFMVAYVGEEKLINKARKVDVQFHAMRGLQELSFDTFKSTKAYEIVVPSNLQMILPHDYVNYVKLSWSDAGGIEHVLYPAIKTSNPLSIDQEADGDYIFQTDEELVDNGDYSVDLSNSKWQKSTITKQKTKVGPFTGGANANQATGGPVTRDDEIFIDNGQLAIRTENFLYRGFANSNVASRCYAVWQEIDVSNFNVLDITATATSHAAGTIHGAGVIKFGLSTEPGSNSTNPYNVTANAALHQRNVNPAYIPNGFLEWSDGNATATEKTIENIDVSDYDTLYVVITSRTVWSQLGSGTGTEFTATNLIDDVSVKFTGEPDSLKLNRESNTWTKFKSNTPRDNMDRYDDGTYDLVVGERYGIDPQHSQVNGSFYIDELAGKIHFSSNISGKTLILKYISDSLGTNEEMQVHKLAEEAMYRYIAHAILAGKANVPEYIVNRFKKEKFAAIRQAKLRLSNIKLEEITQILRGKSKRIKH